MRNEIRAGKLFGKRPSISDGLIEAISNQDSILDDGKPFPVQVLPYIDEETHTVRKQLDSRGIRYDRGLSDQPGIQRISVNRYRKLSRGTPPEVNIENNSQASMNIRIESHSLPEGKAVLRTELLPNEHGIKGEGSKHYLVEEKDLYPVYREPHPRVKKVGKVNLGMLLGNAIVDLINK